MKKIVIVTKKISSETLNRLYNMGYEVTVILR
jgi:hypothetical protein